MAEHQPYIAKWRIVEMEEWDQDFVDLIVPGHFTFRKDGTGSFQFGAVQGAMDWRMNETKSGGRLEFSWEGNDECDPASGRGWVVLEGKELKGHIYFHHGDDSMFTGMKSSQRP